MNRWDGQESNHFRDSFREQKSFKMTCPCVHTKICKIGYKLCFQICTSKMVESYFVIFKANILHETKVFIQGKIQWTRYISMKIRRDSSSLAHFESVFHCVASIYARSLDAMAIKATHSKKSLKFSSHLVNFLKSQRKKFCIVQENQWNFCWNFYIINQEAKICQLNFLCAFDIESCIFSQFTALFCLILSHFMWKLL